MFIASWMMALGFLGSEPGDSPRVSRPIRTVSSTPRGTWRGQDGHDLTGPHFSVKPDGVQDLHITLDDLPPKKIASMVVTSEAGDSWHYNVPGKAWIPVIQREGGSPRAEVYLEPSQVGQSRRFLLTVKFEDGSTAEVAVRGLAFHPNLRMPDAALAVRWLGQDREDFVGPGPSVGPDGIQDIHLALSRLSKDVTIQRLTAEGAAGTRWEFGTNPKGFASAELVRDAKDPTRADLYLQSDRDLSGHALRVVLTYEHGKTDSASVKAGRVDPKLRAHPLTLPKVSASPIKAEWLGQDGGAGKDEVHVVLSGLSASRQVVAAVLTDSVRGCWAVRLDQRAKAPFADPDPFPLDFQRRPDRTRADLRFSPIRDESGTTMTLRLIDQDGASSVVQFAGGRCDVERAAPVPAATSIVAKPGDNLSDLVSRYGTVKLTKGTYALSSPLVLEHPITLTGEAGATLQFLQGASDAPWTAAIKIHSGGTTLHGFAVRFTGPVRWNQSVSWGPAVIGLTDNLDGRPSQGKLGLAFTKLDLEGPPSAKPAGWEEAVRLFRLIGAQHGGKITECVLRGGPIEGFNGPWQFVDNDYRGTPPGTYSHGVLTIHNPFDVVVKGNRARSVGPSGKTWRFLCFTGQGNAERVENNTIVGIGPRDDDTIPPANEPEVILTESYRLKFEGTLSAVSSDRRVVGVVRVHGAPVRTGDVVAILAGPNAGKWRRVAQAITPTTVLLETPLPADVSVISITDGFVDEVYQGNTVDSRGGSGAGDIILAGNHFGTRVADNHFLGGGLAITSFLTESPMIWGWSHVPFFGGIVERNIFEDPEGNSTFGVQHSEYAKSNRGRVYMTLTFRDNTLRWTGPFVKKRRDKKAKDYFPGITMGFPQALDPAEFVVEMGGNKLEAPPGVRAAALRVESGLINSQKIVGRSFDFPGGSGGSGKSATRKDRRSPARGNR